MPREGQAPAFAQKYIHDGTPDAEAEYRQQALGEASLPELQCLLAMLHNVNRMSPSSYREWTFCASMEVQT